MMKKIYDWKEIVIFVNCGFQDRTQSETEGTPTVTDASTSTPTYTYSHTLVIFVSLCPAFYK